MNKIIHRDTHTPIPISLILCNTHLTDKAIPKNTQTTAQLNSSYRLEKKCSKFSKPGFSNMWTVNFQMFNLVLEKTEKPEIKLPTSAGSLKK